MCMVYMKSFKVNSSLFFYMIAYSIFVFFGILSQSFYYAYFAGNTYTAINLFCIVILITRELLFEKINFQRAMGLLLCIVLCVMAIAVSSNGPQRTIGFMFFYIYTFKREYFDTVSKATVYITSFALILVIVSSFLGIIPNYQSAGLRTRYYLGFTYALFAPAFFNNIVSLEVYLKKNKISVCELILLSGINYWLYYYTDSRLAFFMTFVIIFIPILLKWKPYFFDKHRMLCRFMCISFVIGFLISIIVVKYYETHYPEAVVLDSILAHRLSYTSRSLQEYGITWYPRKIPWVGNGLALDGTQSTQQRLFVDCLYIKLLQRYGIIFFVIFMGLLTETMIRIYKKRDYYLLIIMVMNAIHFVIDDLYIYLFYNTFWLLIGCIWEIKPRRILQRIAKV